MPAYAGWHIPSAPRMKPLTLDTIPDNHPLHPRIDPRAEREDRLRLDFRLALLDWTHRALLLIRDSRHPGLTADCVCYQLRFSSERNESQADIAKRNGVSLPTVKREIVRVRRLVKQ